MSKINIVQQFFGPTKTEVMIFFMLLILVIGGLVAAYYYDLHQPFFTEAAKQFYNWLIN